MLVVIVGFPLFGPPRENGGCNFREDPFLSHLGRIIFFTFSHENVENHQTCVFLLLFAPLLEPFALTLGMGGPPFGTILDSF